MQENLFGNIELINKQKKLSPAQVFKIRNGYSKTTDSKNCSNCKYCYIKSIGSRQWLKCGAMKTCQFVSSSDVSPKKICRLYEEKINEK